MSICSVDGCNNEVRCKGMCKYHYQTQWRIGKTTLDRPVFVGTPEERFDHYTEKGDGDSCWKWVGNKNSHGYGQMRSGKKMVSAHRFSYELHYGKIEDDSFVLHKCNNPDCVNPAHLYLGDHSQNMKDRLKSGNYATGERHPNSKFSDETVNLIRMESGTNKYISQKYGVSITQVRNIRSFAQRSA